MQPPRSLEPQVRRAFHAVSTLREVGTTRSIERSRRASKSEPLLLNNKTSPCNTWPAQGRLGLSPKPTPSHIWRGRDRERSADSSFNAMQEWKERIDQRGAAGRPLLILRVARSPAPRVVVPIIRTPLLPLRRTLGDILRLTIRLSDAGMRNRTTKLIYPNHRLPSLAHRRRDPAIARTAS